MYFLVQFVTTFDRVYLERGHCIHSLTALTVTKQFQNVMRCSKIHVNLILPDFLGANLKVLIKKKRQIITSQVFDCIVTFIIKLRKFVPEA